MDYGFDTHAVTGTRTISLETPRKAIIYVLVCIACLVGSVALADLAVLLLFRFG